MAEILVGGAFNKFPDIFGQIDETVNHIIRDCNKLEQKKAYNRHDFLVKAVQDY